jgi:hypothetical protein
MIRKRSLGVVLLVLLFTAQAFSQSSTIGGVVTDASRMDIPD